MRPRLKKDITTYHYLEILIFVVCLLLLLQIAVMVVAIQLQINMHPYYLLPNLLVIISKKLSTHSSSIFGIGCRNPIKYAHIKEGDIVRGFRIKCWHKCFFVSDIVKENGKVIGIGMTIKRCKKQKTMQKIHLQKCRIQSRRY